MGFVTSIVMMMMIWWVVFLASLPFGYEQQTDTKKGFATSAPKHPKLKQKLFYSTLITALIFGFLWWGVDTGFVNLRAWIVSELRSV